MCIGNGRTGSAYSIGTHEVNRLYILESTDDDLRAEQAIVHYYRARSQANSLEYVLRSILSVHHLLVIKPRTLSLTLVQYDAHQRMGEHSSHPTVRIGYVTPARPLTFSTLHKSPRWQPMNQSTLSHTH